MKKVFLIIFAAVLFMNASQLLALDFMVGAKSGYYLWRPYYQEFKGSGVNEIETIGIFNIIGKERLNDVMKEQEFQLSCIVRESDITKLGELVGAKYILTGTFMEMDGSMRIEAQAYSVEKGTQLGTASITGKTESFFDLVKELFVEVSGFLDTMLTEEEEQTIVEKVETKSVEASLSNYKGEIAVMKAEELKEEGKEKEAREAIEEAEAEFKKALEV